MRQVLVTVLSTLTIPAIALAVIVGMERSSKRRRERESASDDKMPEFAVTTSAKAFVDTGKAQPAYRKRAG